MEEHLVKDFLGINLMEVNKLVDLNNLRTAPKLSYGQEKKLLEELEANILNTAVSYTHLTLPTNHPV